MRFVAKQAKEGINVSDTHPLVEAGTLVIGLTAIFIVIALSLIFAVEAALYFVSAEDEAALFGDWLPEDIITVAPDDERLYETQSLVDRLVQHWPDAPYQFRVEIDDSEIANAMALPGGLIIVTQGLLDQVESENELAFVLGHELGHFKNRDHLRALGRGIVMALFFTVVTGNDVAGIGIKAADLTLRGFSRRQETKADEFGLAVAYSEYGHVDNAWRLFERWDTQDSALIDIATYLSTHPEAGDRVVDMKARAVAEGWRVEGDLSPLGWQSE
jgi:Zn-dependent protease with chaperone function